MGSLAISTLLIWLKFPRTYRKSKRDYSQNWQNLKTQTHERRMDWLTPKEMNKLSFEFHGPLALS
jgi:hypothetical protein